MSRRGVRAGALALALVTGVASGLTATAGADETGTEFVEPVPSATAVVGEHGTLVDDATPIDVSADGNRVLVISRPAPYGNSDSVPAVIDRATGRKYRVDEVFDRELLGVRMAAGGRYVAIAGRRLGIDSGIWRWDLVTNSVQPVAVSSAGPLLTLMAISDTGRYIYAHRDRGGRDLELVRFDVVTGSELVVAMARGEGFRRDLGDPAPEYMSFASNGRYVLYAAGRGTSSFELRRVDVDTGADVVIEDLDLLAPGHCGHADTAIAPTGRYVAYCGYWKDLATGERTRIADPWTGPEQFVEVAADGTVAMSTAQNLQPEVHQPTHLRLYVWKPGWEAPRIGAFTDHGTVLRHGAPNVLNFSLSDNGRWLVFGNGESVHRDLRPNDLGFRRGVVSIIDLDAAPPQDFGVVDATFGSGHYLVINRVGSLVRGPAHLYSPDYGSGGGPDPRPLLAVGEFATSVDLTPDGNGYWVFTNHGRVLTYGSAQHFGDMTGVRLSGPVIDSVATPTGLGYYMVGSDGGVFAFGDAKFFGSVPEVLPGVRLAAPVVGITATAGGYRMIAADGGIFSFGDAPFHGSLPGVLGATQLARPLIGMVSTGAGYLGVASDGGIFAFGNADFYGSLGGAPPPTDIATVVFVPATESRAAGYAMFDRNGRIYPFGGAPS